MGRIWFGSGACGRERIGASRHCGRIIGFLWIAQPGLPLPLLSSALSFGTPTWPNWHRSRRRGAQLLFKPCRRRRHQCRLALQRPLAPVGTAPNASPSPSATCPTFAETHETLRNSDVEVQLTNKGGAISEVTLLNQRAIDGPVVLNAGNQTPIAANVSDPASPITAGIQGDAAG